MDGNNVGCDQASFLREKIAKRLNREAIEARVVKVIQQFSKLVRARVREHDIAQLGVDVDDIEQEVRIRIWSTLSKDPDIDLPAQYIQKIVYAVLVDSSRKQRARPHHFTSTLDSSERDIIDHAPQPDLALSQFQGVQILAECIGRLPSRRQLPVQLFLNGYSLRELSDINGLSLDASSKLVSRGLKELRSLIAAKSAAPSHLQP